MIEHTIGYEVYLIELFQYFRYGFVFLFAASLIVFIVNTLPSLVEGTGLGAFSRLVAKHSLFFLAVAFIGIGVIPNEDTMYLILADSVNREVAEGKISEKAISILEAKLSERGISR